MVEITPSDAVDLYEWAVSAAATMYLMNNPPEEITEEQRLEGMIQGINMLLADVPHVAIGGAIELANQVMSGEAYDPEELELIEEFRKQIDESL